MSCCGQKRAGVGMRSVATASGTFSGHVLPATDPFRTASGVTLRYAGSGPFTLRGPRSGRVYTCSTTGAAVIVDPSDVDALLRTRLFKREGIVNLTGR